MKWNGEKQKTRQKQETKQNKTQNKTLFMFSWFLWINNSMLWSLLFRCETQRRLQSSCKLTKHQDQWQYFGRPVQSRRHTVSEAKGQGILHQLCQKLNICSPNQQNYWFYLFLYKRL